MEIKFQEFLTFGICEKLSKNGRFSRYNLGKFVIFENWLVNWIMLNYIAYLIYFVKIEIKRILIFLDICTWEEITPMGKF